jgi:hypothetical protein
MVNLWHWSDKSPTCDYAAPSDLKDQQEAKDGQQPCFTFTGLCHLSQSLMAATSRFIQS